MLLAIALGCSGSEDPPPKPLPGEAVLVVDTVRWTSDSEIMSLAVADLATNPAIVSVRFPGYDEDQPQPVLNILTAPFSGGNLTRAASGLGWDGPGAGTAVVDDWNGDGIDDVAVTGEILLGPFDREGTTRLATWEFTVSGTPRTDRVHGCDVDQDGARDLCSNHGVLRGPFAGSYTEADLDVALTVPVVGGPDRQWGQGALVTDLTGDGRDELLITTSYDTIHRIHLLKDPGASAHWALDTESDVIWTGASPDRPDEWTTADIDEDGVDDLLVAVGTTQIVTDTAGGDLSGAAIHLEGFGTGVVAGDFDGDGTMDVATSVSSLDEAQVALWLGPLQPGTYGRLDAAAIWKTDTDQTDGFGSPMVAADLDLDGRHDLIVAAPDGSDQLYLLWGGGL